MADLTAALRKALQTCSAENLTWIGERWAVAPLLPDGESEVEKERRLVDIISARFAWDALSPNARELLHQIISVEVMDGIPRKEIQALTSLETAEFVAALAELEQGLMLIETRPDPKIKKRLEEHGASAKQVLIVPNDFQEFFLTIDEEIYSDYGDLSKLQLVDVLAALDPVQLQTIYTVTSIYGGRSGYYSASNAQERFAKTVAGKLVQANVIEFLWNQLDATEQNICRWLCRSDGKAQVAEIQLALNLSRSSMAHQIYRLQNYGLVFDTFSDQQHSIFIGRGTFKVLRQHISEIDLLETRARRLASAPMEQQEAPPYVRDASSTLLYDLAIAIGAVYQMIIEPTQAGRIPKRITNKIAPLLHGSRINYYEENDYYLDMVFTIASTLGLIKVQESLGQKAHYIPGPDLDKWKHLEAAGQTYLLLEVWSKALDRSWSDIAGVNYRSDDFGFGMYMEASSSRQGLLAYLTEHCQPGHWYILEPFLQSIKASHPLILRERSRYANYAGMRNRKDILTKWDHIDAEIIAGMLASSLHELGLTALGSRTDPSTRHGEEASNPDAFQFSELAARVLWEKPTAVKASNDDERPRTLIVQPNFELLLLQPDYPTLYKLLPFTKINQVEMVSRLVLTQESVRRGVETGFSVEQIIATLQACSQKELPQNVLYTLQDWGRLYKDATVSQILLLEVSSEAIADEICASPKFRALELRRLGPCALAIDGQVSMQVLRTTLEKEGIIMRVQGNILSTREFASTSISGYGKRR